MTCIGQGDINKYDMSRGLKNASTMGIALLLPLGTLESLCEEAWASHMAQRISHPS